MNIPLQFPLAGVVLDPPQSGQPPGTTREAQNVRGRDPITLQSRGAQRAGHVRFLESTLGSGPVRDLNQVVTDVPRVTYAQRGYSDAYPLTERWSVAPEKGQSVLACAVDIDKSVYTVNAIGGVMILNPSGEVVRNFALPGPSDGVTPMVPVRRIKIDETGAIYFAANHGTDTTLFRYIRVSQEKGYFDLQWRITISSKSIVDFDIRNGDIVFVTQGGGNGRLYKYIGVVDFEPEESWNRDVGFAEPWSVRLGAQGAAYVGIRKTSTTEGILQKWTAGGDHVSGWDQTLGGIGDQMLITAGGDIITCGRKFGDDVVCRKIVDLGTTSSVDAGTQAAEDLTFSGVGADGDTVTITGDTGARVYTLRSVIDDDVANEVLIGASATDTAQNLADAINHTTSLTTYSDATTINLDVLASAAAGVVTVTARVAGEDGNAIAVETTSADASWGGASLSGGVDGDGAWAGEDTEDIFDVVGYHGALEADSNGDLYIGIADLSVSKHFQKRGGAHGYVLAEYEPNGGPSQTVYGIGLPPIEPNYHTRSITGPTYCYLGLSIGVPGTDNNTVFRLDLTKALHDAGSDAVTRRVVYTGICGGDFVTFERDGVATIPSGGGGVVDDASLTMSSATIFGKVYFTDGISYSVYDPEGYDETPRRDSVSEWRAVGIGEIPERAKLLVGWAGRAVIARTTDDPHAWAMSAKGNPLKWEFFAITPTVTDATIGSDSRYGPCPDIINALIPYSDDFLIVGGDSSIHQFTGDPGLGNGFRILSDVTGIAYQSPWCKDESGVLYFFGSRGGVYAMSPGSMPSKITTDTVDAELLDIDLAANRIVMVWDTNLQSLMIYVCARGVPDVATKHWCWEKQRGWFWDTYATQALQPTAATVFDGDSPDDRVVAIGRYDGRVMYIDRNAKDDDGERIESSVTFGPLAPYGSEREAWFKSFQGCLASDQNGCDYEWLVGDAPDSMRSVDRGKLSPGLNPIVRSRARGSYVSFRLANLARGERWALESLNLDGSSGTIRRARI